jgi:hypothetical protein
MHHQINPVTKLGLAYRRRGDTPFGMHQRDRLLHLYILGQTGVGKSTLLYNMARQDALLGTGFCLIDPHGDLANDLAQVLPENTIIWNLADPDCPYGYNPLTHTSPRFRPLVASGLIEAFKKQWADAWGVRMEHLLRYAILALLDQPETDMQDIMRMFLEKEFRKSVIAQITDPQVRQFWTEEFPSMNYKTAADGVAPIANKLGAFLAHPIIRKSVCAPEKPLRFRQIMDQGRVLIINLAKGQLGADIANVMGGLIVSSITHAAFSRHNLPEEERVPYMAYIDEFHSFTTEAIADTLSETRKYGLGLTLAQQHTKQCSAALLEGIIGNAGSIICFRVGARDAPLMAKQLGAVEPRDLINLPNHHTFVRLMVHGNQTKAFSARTLPRQP